MHKKTQPSALCWKAYAETHKKFVNPSAGCRMQDTYTSPYNPCQTMVRDSLNFGHIISTDQRSTEILNLSLIKQSEQQQASPHQEQTDSEKATCKLTTVAHHRVCCHKVRFFFLFLLRKTSLLLLSSLFSMRQTPKMLTWEAYLFARNRGAQSFKTSVTVCHYINNWSVML